MGDLVCGFEEMQGVKLGYLLIKGKQMFALSQVFTDLLKNIPRTTVHKRMDYLNVKKHHCCLEELRKLKAIKSIAFHAAKCTLISREDVEALYFSCKTERVLKSNKRKVTPSSHGDTRNGLVQLDTHAGLWKDKVWLSLHGVPETLSLINKAGRVEVPCFSDSELPPIYSESHQRNNNLVSKFDSKSFKNYETTRITGNRTTFHEKNSFFRSVVNQQPLIFQSAVDTRCKLPGAASDLLHKRKRRRERANGRNSAKHSWSRRRHTQHPPVLLVQPQCCGKQKTPSGITLGPINVGLDYDFYLNHRHRQHHDHQQSFQESCSSDTESSSYSEQVNNDSDFGSSFSTSSNSGTSEEDEDDSPLESSDVSSDEESSTQSDSSSVSSQVSLQSIRFRRPRLGSLTKTPNTKAPLVLQPTFQYNLQQKTQQRTSGCFGIPENIYRINTKTTNEFSNVNEVGVLHNQKCNLPMQGSLLTELGGGVVTGQKSDPKRANGGDYAQGPSTYANRDKVFLQRRTQGSANKCPPGLSPYCAHNKDSKILNSTNNHQFSLTINLKREVKTSTNIKSQSLLKNNKPIKTEADEPPVTVGSQSDSFVTTIKTPPLILNKIEIKVEESCEEYEHSSQATSYPCKKDIVIKGPCEDIKPADYFKNATNAPGSSAWGPKSPSYSQEFQATHNSSPKSREFTTGARVRKNYATLLLKNTNVIARKLNKRVSSCTAAKGYSGYTYAEDLSRESKRKRPVSSFTSFLKKPFSLLENFPFPPSLVVGSDGDLSPAYSMNSLRNQKPPARSHPVWRWEAGGPPFPTPLQGIRKC